MPSFCPFDLDFTLCNGLAYTYQSVCSFSIAIQIETIVYVCIVCISLMSQPYFSLFPVGGARGREKDIGIIAGSLLV